MLTTTSTSTKATADTPSETTKTANIKTSAAVNAAFAPSPTSPKSHSTSLIDFVASAPGKVILAGEHAVVHGTHAIATVIDKRTYAQFNTNQSNSLTLHLLDINKTFYWELTALKIPEITNNNNNLHSEPLSLKHLPNCDTPSATVFLLIYTYLMTERSIRPPLICTVRSELPMSAGLGSSASYCAAIAAGLYHISRITHAAKEVANIPLSSLTDTHFSADDLAVINRYAFEGERLLHGNPSGVDNTCAVYGGIVVYKKGEPFRALKLPKVELILTNTKQPRDTKKLVAAVGQRLKQYETVVRPILDSIEAITGVLISSVNKSNNASTARPASTAKQQQPVATHSSAASEELVSIMSDMFDINQALLVALGVGHIRINHVIDRALEFGLSSKLTGAGGGGCVLTIIPPTSNATSKIKNFINVMIKEYEYDSFTTVIGQNGIDIILGKHIDAIMASRNGGDGISGISISTGSADKDRANTGAAVTDATGGTTQSRL